MQFIDRLLPQLDLQGRTAEDGHVDAAIAAAAIMAFEETQRVQLPNESDSSWKRAGRDEALKGRL